jgi:cytochrome oxidase Cu insertion factor (SCO1/SenC/PrrC family)
MAGLAAARRSLPPALADKVTAVLVTVDPLRDTPPVLERWLGQFDPDFIGLHAPTELVNQAERSLYPPESGEESAPAADPGTGGHHESSPSATTPVVMRRHRSLRLTTRCPNPARSVFCPGDKLLLYAGGTPAQEYAEDFTRLLTP